MKRQLVMPIERDETCDRDKAAITRLKVRPLRDVAEQHVVCIVGEPGAMPPNLLRAFDGAITFSPDVVGANHPTGSAGRVSAYFRWKTRVLKVVYFAPTAMNLGTRDQFSAESYAVRQTNVGSQVRRALARTIFPPT
jgi:hypothetical protein